MLRDGLAAADRELGPCHCMRREQNEVRNQHQHAGQTPGYILTLEPIAEDVYRKNQHEGHFAELHEFRQTLYPGSSDSLTIGRTGSSITMNRR